MSMDFDQCCIRFGTDKSSKFHNYAVFYQRFFDRIIQNKDTVKILEIGVKDGNSLDAYNAYFKNCEITGIDINFSNELRKRQQFAEIIIEDAVKFDAIKKKLGQKKFDIIIDDASHISGHQIECFENYHSFLNPGGVYIIEDLHTSYWKLVKNSQEVINDKQNMSFRAKFGNSGYKHENGLSNQKSAVNYLKSLVDKVNCEGRSPISNNGYEENFDHDLNLASITFIRSSCIIEKL